MKNNVHNKFRAARFNQRSVEFYSSAECLRNHKELAVFAIDYCTALAFELRLKSILALRNKFTEKQKTHNIEKLFEECQINISDAKQRELIKYYNIILRNIGRYSISNDTDREILDCATSNMFCEEKDPITSTKNRYYNVDNNSGIADDTYKDIWNILYEIYDSESKSIK